MFKIHINSAARFLWSLSKAKLGLLLFALIVASLCYMQMERRLAKKIPFRLPRIPRPRHKVIQLLKSARNGSYDSIVFPILIYI